MYIKDQQYHLFNKSTVTSESIVLRPDSSEEEITKKLKKAPLDLTVKIAAAIGTIWRESA
ncbi:hypothetical protein [Myxosarcina sp. GI1(2024)]